MLMWVLFAVVSHCTDLTEEPEGALTELVDEHIANTQDMPSGVTPAVSIEFYYGTTCMNCLVFMHQALLPLVQAQLPGSGVQLTLLPWVREYGSLDECLASDDCYFALAPLCVFEATIPQQPSPIDAPGLHTAVEFAVCDHTSRIAAGPDGARVMHEDSIRECAAKAGLPWDGPNGLAACTLGPRAWNILQSSNYRSKMAAADRVFAQGPDLIAPFLLLNGDELRCQGSSVGVECTQVWSTSRGLETFAMHGDLLSVACSKLQPEPAVCHGARRSRGPVLVGPTPACENCMQTGAFQWHMSHGHELSLWHQTSAGAAIALALGGLCGLIAWRLTSRNRASHRTSSAETKKELFVE